MGPARGGGGENFSPLSFSPLSSSQLSSSLPSSSQLSFSFSPLPSSSVLELILRADCRGVPPPSSLVLPPPVGLSALFQALQNVLKRAAWTHLRYVDHRPGVLHASLPPSSPGLVLSFTRYRTAQTDLGRSFGTSNIPPSHVHPHLL